MRSSSYPYLAFLSLLLTSLLLAACGGGGDSAGDDASGDAEPAAERRFLSLGTAPTGGAFFVVGGALAEVADQYGEAGWNVTAEATAGSQENIRRLIDGDLDFALSNAAISYFAVRGGSGWETSYPIRAVMTLAPNVALFVTPADSGIETIADLRGKRVSVGPAGAGFEMFVGPLLGVHGLSYDDFKPLNATQSGAVDLLSDGSADAAFLGGAVPTASITQAATSMDLRLIPFDGEAMAMAVQEYPFFAPATIPAGTYRGQEEDYHGLNVGSMHLITSEDASEELVYAFTKAIYEHRDAVVERHPAGKAIRPEVVVRNTGTPFHPGAERFYREIGIWPRADEAADNEGGGGEGEKDRQGSGGA
jgi:TRAP transporter TAXI family solute receptor